MNRKYQAPSLREYGQLVALTASGLKCTPGIDSGYHSGIRSDGDLDTHYHEYVDGTGQSGMHDHSVDACKPWTPQ